MKHLLLIFLILVALWTTTAAQSTDTSTSTPVIAAQTEDGIAFYTTDASTQLTRIGGLPDDFVLSDAIVPGNWNIPAVESMAVSPDSEKIAFAARLDENEIRLFIYSFVQDDLQQIEVENTFFPDWAPDGQAIFLWGYEGYALYDLQTEVLYSLAIDSTVGILPHWLPDSSALAYGSRNGIYILNRDNLTHQQLVDTTSEAGDSIEGHICRLKWSPFDQRLYYGVRCITEGHSVAEILYSVDLDGNVRQVTSAPVHALFPERFLGQFYDIYTLPDTDKFYAFITVNQIFGSTVGYWSILQLFDDQGRWIERFNAEFDYAPLGDVALSPDHTKMAITSQNWNGNGVSTRFVTVVDLLAGAEIIERNHTTGYLCEVTWQDAQTILYSVDSVGYCKPDIQPGSMEVYSLDVATGTAVNVTADLTGSAWIIRSRSALG